MAQNTSKSTEEKSSTKFDRRSALKSVFGTTFGVSMFSYGTTVADARKNGRKPNPHSNYRPPGKAKKIADEARARYAREPSFESWSTAKIGGLTKYHRIVRSKNKPKHEPSAYVYPVKQRSESVGYLTISPDKNRFPVLEASTAKPPHETKEHAKRAARAEGDRLTGRLLYNGATSYAAETKNGRMAYFGTGIMEELPEESPKLSFEKRPNAVNTPETLAAQDSHIQASSNTISGVPVWDANGGSGNLSGSDDGNADTSAPDLYGRTPDPWDTWDGCAPFAGAQCMMYHENLAVADVEQREEIVDRLHLLMDTDPQGWTGYLDPSTGITDYPTDQLQHDYTGHEEVLLSKDLFRNEVDHNRPFMLNIPSNDLSVGGKKKKPYSGHSIVVYGYAVSDGGLLGWGSTFEVVHHNSWDLNEHRIQYGNWPFNTWATRVVP